MNEDMDTYHYKEELFNMRHYVTKNVIKRTFEILKILWDILISTPFYPMKI